MITKASNEKGLWHEHATELLYDSEKDDRWFIGSDVAEPRVFVRHEPNKASGGQPANFGLMEFLAQQQGPQHESLLSLLSRLIAERLEPDD